MALGCIVHRTSGHVLTVLYKAEHGTYRVYDTAGYFATHTTSSYVTALSIRPLKEDGAKSTLTQPFALGYYRFAACCFKPLRKLATSFSFCQCRPTMFQFRACPETSLPTAVEVLEKMLFSSRHRFLPHLASSWKITAG